MVESIKQEQMECSIEQPPLKKIKQEVSVLQRRKREDLFFLFLAAVANVA